MADEKSRDPEYKPNQPLRRFLQFLARGALNALTDLEIEGEENFPKSGPLIMVGNHFSFIDPVAFVSLAPWPMDFVGGAVTPHAPKIVQAHRRIDLQESHFSMLADALFKAMRQTLSDEALPDIALQAWRRAYDHLATILIQQQREMATQPTIVIQTTP